MSDFQQARIDLGARLRRLREESRLTGKELAARLNWQPSKVSRIENARQTPTGEDVAAWARAVRAAPRLADELVAAATALAERQEFWRRRHRAGPAVPQGEPPELEAQTAVFRVFEPGIVPDLLQTAEYARSVCAALRHRHRTAEEVDEAARRCLRRQEILYDRARRFRFLLSEAALRHRTAPPEVMAGQLDRLLAVTGLPNVEFGVIPFSARYPWVPLHGFRIYDESAVGVPTVTRWLTLTAAEDVAAYADVFDGLHGAAVFREQARAVLVRALDAVVGGPAEERPHGPADPGGGPAPGGTGRPPRPEPPHPAR